MSTWTTLSSDIAAAVAQAAPSIVQVHGRGRVAAGLVVAEHLILSPARADADTLAVRAGNGHTAEGAVLGRIGHMGLTVLRVDGLGLRPLAPAADAQPGDLAVAVGRTWSGGVMAALAPVAVVGGPLRTGRGSAIERVIRIQHAPHGALNGGALIAPSGEAAGIITGMAIRGTTVVIPAAAAWSEAARVAAGGGPRQGFLGVSTLTVAVPERQRGGGAFTDGLLISQVAAGSPAEAAGVLVGDVLVAFNGQAVTDPEDLLNRLRGAAAGTAVPITVIRGAAAVDVTVTIGERPSR